MNSDQIRELIEAEHSRIATGPGAMADAERRRWEADVRHTIALLEVAYQLARMVEAGADMG